MAMDCGLPSTKEDERIGERAVYVLDRSFDHLPLPSFIPEGRGIADAMTARQIAPLSQDEVKLFHYSNSR